ncbi:MAG TPA: hypothetical protein VFE50_25440 [Cyclobacteriaceae bacterium]|nr:hypothetical protein [Cyclobacteriaceae bacterium]
MENEFDDLKSIWRSAKKNPGHLTVSTADLIRHAESKKRSSIVTHYANMGVLTAVAIMLALAFYFWFPFREVLSRIGIGLMIGGLLIRIVIEAYSVRKSKIVKVSDTTAEATENTIAFLEFRKKVNGPVTYGIVGLYIVGFYVLSPEWSRYISTSALVLTDVGFLFGAIGMTWLIRGGIRQEMEDLQIVADIKNQLRNDS